MAQDILMAWSRATDANGRRIRGGYNCMEKTDRKSKNKTKRLGSDSRNKVRKTELESDCRGLKSIVRNVQE